MTTTDEAREADVYWDGFIAGALGAVVVALWFLVLDLAAGHPLRTPTMLGEALLSGPAAAAAVDHARQDVVAAYSGVHLALFVGVGLLLSWLVARLRRRARALALLGGVLLLFDVATWGLLRALAAPVAGELGAWTVLVGNLLAAGVMAGYFVLRVPDLADGPGSRAAGHGGP